VLVENTREWLDEYVGNVFSGRDRDDYNIAVLYTFANIVVLNVDVLRAGVSLCRLCEGDRGRVVCPKCCR